MKLRTPTSIFVLATTLALGSHANAQIYDTNNDVVQIFAGSGFHGYLDGQGTQTMFSHPSAIVTDSSSNLFVWDSSNYRVRKISPDATVTTFAGGGSGGLPGYGTNVALAYDFASMTIDHSNALWFAWGNGGYSFLVRIGGDAYASIITLSGVSFAFGACVDSANNIYVSDLDGNKIYRYHQTNRQLEAFVGSGNGGSADGNGAFTSFANPKALASDAADNIYVWDSANYLLRRINQNRDVVTISGGYGNSDGAGTNALFTSISSMCLDNSGSLILACDSSIRKMTAATNVLTLAGSFGERAYTNGPGNLARFNVASGVCLSQGMVFVADQYNQRIRFISFNPQPQAVTGGNLAVNTYPGVTIMGLVGRTYQIQSSGDLTNWNTVTTLLLGSSPYLWIDQNAIGQKKFYRALLLP